MFCDIIFVTFKNKSPSFPLYKVGGSKVIGRKEYTLQHRQWIDQNVPFGQVGVTYQAFFNSPHGCFFQ